MATVSNLEVERDNLEGVVAEENAESLQHHYHYSCNFCSASFTSELGLILHFRGEHYLNRGDGEEEDDDNLDLSNDDDGAEDSEPEEEGPAWDELDFLTDCERTLLADEPDLDPYPELDEEQDDDLDLEADTEPQEEAEISWEVIVGPEHEDYKFWKGLPSSEKTGGGSSHGESQVSDHHPSPTPPKKKGKPANNKALLLRRNSTTSTPGGRRQLTLRLLPLLHSPEKKKTTTTRPTPGGKDWKETTRARTKKDEDKVKTKVVGAPAKTKDPVPVVKAHNDRRGSRSGVQDSGGGGHQYQFECIFCGKTYQWEYLFHTHIRGHIMERPYFCKLCDKSYAQQNYLTEHMRKYHVGGSPYQCKLCRQAFASQGKLRNHQVKVHPGELPKPVFKCEYCDMTFSKQWNLTRHRRVHLAEEGYKCKHCNSVFARSDNLLAHVRELHRVNLTLLSIKM